MIDAIINAIWQWIAWVAENVINWLMETVNSLVQGLTDMFTTIYNWFQEVFASIFTYLETALTRIVTFFETILQDISDFAARVWAAFEDLTTDVIDAIQNFIEDAWSEIRTAVETLLDDALQWLSSIADDVVRLISAGMDAVTSLAERIKDTVVGWIDEIVQAAIQGYQEMVAGFTKALDAFLGAAGSFIAAIETRLSELKIAFAEAATDVVAGISETAEEAFGPIRDSIQNVFKEVFDFADEGEVSAMMMNMRQVTAGEKNVTEIRDLFKYSMEKLVPTSKFWRSVFLIVTVLAGAVPMIMQMAGIAGNVAVQEFARQVPYQLFNPADVTAAWRRGFVSKDVAVDTIRRQGYSEEDAEIVLNLSQQVPQEGDLLQLFHRGLIDEADLDKAFLQKGYTEQYRDQLKTASFLIPPVNDLILMAVREAFTPEIAERFGQYEDFPQDLADWASKQGLTVEWARRYWAAHWALPSPQQGFEMLHRGIIGPEDLDLLLRALDVMPFWRDRLVKIAYTPFTRIDIRRMHRVGVLSEEDVNRSYQDLGYDQAKAKTMTDFVMLLNAPKTADDEIELKDLSRSSVVNFYGDGLIQREKAVSLLEGLGYTSNAAHLYLDSTDMDAERKERKAEVSLTTALAEAGAITFEQAEDRLRKIGLETQEVNKAIIALVRKQQQRTKIPSRTEAERMAKFGIIDADEYKEFLGLLGYSEKWVNAYVELSQRAG